MSFSIWLQEKKKPKIGIDHQQTDMMRNKSTSVTEQRIKSNFETWLEHKDDPIRFSTQPQPQPQQPTPTTNTSLTQREIERNTMAGVADPTADNYDPDFLSKSGYVSTRMQPENSYFDVPTYDFYAGTAGDQDSGYSDTTYEFINGNTEISELTVGMHHNYYYMTDEEIAVYNYYHINDRNAGTNYAQRYLELIQEDLNRRAAKEEYAKYEGKPVAQMTYAAKSGIHNFGTTIDNWYRQEDGYIAPTATQLTSGLIKEELLDGKEYSVGGFIYDVIETLAFMAPSALATAAATMLGGPAVGSIVGNTLSGAASGATAYQEKINEGYTPEQANTYGILLASTEIAIEFLLKGGTKLGGAAIKKVLPQIGKLDGILQKVAKSVGGQIAAGSLEEGSIEAIETFFAPYIAGVLMGKEITPDIEEALYSGLIGLLTGGLVKAGEISGIIPNIDNPDVNAEYGTQGKVFIDPDPDSNTATDAEVSPSDTTTTDQIPESPLNPQIPAADTGTPSTENALPGSATTNPQAVSPETATADPAPQAETQTVTSRTQQLLEKAVSQMHSKPMEPKLYNALFSYEQKLLQFKRTKNILAETRAKLTQQQASGASPIEIRQTQMDIAKLEKMASQKEAQLKAAEGEPLLQKAAMQQTKLAPEGQPENQAKDGEAKAISSTPPKNTSRKQKKQDVLANNRNNGQKFEVEAFEAFKGTAKFLEKQVTIKVGDTKVRVDAIGVFTDENGNDIIQILEFKSSETAPLTRNQAKVFSTIQTEGGVVVGAGKGFFHGGKLIPAGTPVKIIRKTQGGN